MKYLDKLAPSGPVTWGDQGDPVGRSFTFLSGFHQARWWSRLRTKAAVKLPIENSSTTVEFEVSTLGRASPD